MTHEDWIISVDDHVIEPPDTWTSRLPARHRDEGPRVVQDDQGEAWLYGDKRIPVGGAVTQAGRHPSEYDPSPQRYGQMAPACYDSRARLDAMDADGVLASLAFPNLPRFCGQEFYEAKDRDLGLLCVKAYNDFLLDEWGAVAPARMPALIIIPLWDPHLAAAEIERCAAKGARSVAFSEHPPSLGLPSIHDPGRWWDPVFAAASDAGMPLSIHIGSSSTVPSTGPDAPHITIPVLVSYACATTFTDWLFSETLARFPKLRISLAEGGIGWIPFVLRSADRQVQHYEYMSRFVRATSGFIGEWKESDTKHPLWPHGELPAIEAMRRHIRGCFIASDHGVMARETIDDLGADLFLAETDYPHMDSSFPSSRAAFSKLLDGLPDDDAYKLRQGNALEWFGLDHAGMLCNAPTPADSSSGV